MSDVFTYLAMKSFQNHFLLLSDIYQVIPLYPLNLHKVICQLYLNNAGVEMKEESATVSEQEGEVSMMILSINEGNIAKRK